MLTMIEMQDQGRAYRFNKIEELESYFLDQIVKEDPQAVLYCDRCTQVLPAFAKMTTAPAKYVVLHSALTPSGYLDDDAYSVYQPITSLTAQNKLNGVISSTHQEAIDVKNKLKVDHSYAIPVTFIKEEHPVSFSSRKSGNVIAVARVDEIKQLSHLINVIINLKPQFSQLSLSIYGNNTSQKEMTKLQNLVSQNKAEAFIHFCGFTQNLDAVYNSAQMEVLTSKNEGFAMALIEAQAHGVPAVSYDINYGPKEIIENNKSGKLVTANDIQQLENVIANLLAHPALLEKYSAGAYVAAQKFDFIHVKEKWQQFLTQEGLI